MSEKQSITSKINPSDFYGLAILAISVLLAAVITLSYFLFFRAPAPAEQIVKNTQVATPQANSSGGASASNDDADDEDDYDDEYDDEDDYDDWEDEPLQVVNEIDLPDIELTKANFERNCMSCHGADGKGDGVASEFLIPRPRDFVASPYRFAAEWADEAHIVADLERTIRSGVPRSAMPAFGGVLSEAEIAGLAQYVSDMRDTDQVSISDVEVDVGARPPLTVELVNLGKDLFTNLACATCHGETGAGDGQLAMSLVDFQQNPVRPADFTSGLFKSGQRSEDIVRTILKGVPGTPMVSYEGILLVENEDTEEETYNTLNAWALAAYIRTLAPKVAPPGIPSGSEIKVLPALDQAMLTDPVHPAWVGVPASTLRVNPLQTRHDELSYVDVRTVRMGDEIAVCIEWHDSTLNPLNGSEDRHPDGMSIMFGFDESPSAVQVTAVEAPSDKPTLNEWRWGADKQYQCAGGDSASPEIDFALLAGLPFYAIGAEGSSSQAPTKEMTGLECAVIESNGLVPQPEDQQGAVASAAWINGIWRVVIKRKITTNDDMDVQFTGAARVPISVSIWNGSEGTRLDAMSVSSWHWLIVDPE